MTPIRFLKGCGLILFLPYLTFLGILFAGCGGGSASPTTPPPSPTITSVSLSLTSVSLPSAGTQQFAATVTGTGAFSTAVSWAVNGTLGGTSVVGMINSSGLYTAPGVVPSPNLVLISATSVADPTKSATAQVTITTAPPSFSISVSPQSQSFSTGQSTSLSLSVNALNGFNQTIEVSVAGLPSGVTPSPTSPFSMTTSGESVTLTASSSAALGSSTVTFNATSGSLESSTQATISVTQGTSGPTTNRTSFVRTDDTPQAVVYDPMHKLIFASALDLNCVDVIPMASQQVAQCIPVSGALGLSLSADGTEVIVGTQIGVVAWINTSTLQVVKRDIVPQIPNPQFGVGFGYVTAAQAFQAASGKVLLFSLSGCCSLGTFNQSVGVVEWDPVAGTSTVRSTDSGGGGVVSATSDHSKFLVAGGGQVSLYDSSTDQFTPVPGIQFQDATINPMGSQFAVLGGSPFGVKFFNLQMQQVGSTGLPSCCALQTNPSVAVYSPDGKYLYLTYVLQPGDLPVLLTIDATSFQIVGSATGYSTGGLIGFNAMPQTADATGLVLEIADHGVAINDATSVHDFTNAVAIGGFFMANPAEGPLNTATSTQFTTVFPNLPEIFFGAQQGQVSGQAGSDSISATAPPSSVPGPVNVMAIETNGVAAFMPQGFTYGAVPLQYGLLAGDPRGGVVADLLGFGYSADIQSASIQVSLGSSQATVQSKNSLSGSGYPFSLQHLVVAVPSGTPGAQDIKVTSSTGTAVSPKAFHYIKAVTDYPSADTFSYVLYDSHRDQLYLSAGDHIDVFSMATNNFVAPIAIPSRSGTRLILGLALTPDGSKLLAANQSDQSVAIINPDNPNSGAIAVNVPPTPLSGNPGPFQIATTSTNQAFVTLTVGNALTGGSTPLYSIDLSSLQITTANLPGAANLNLNNNYIAASADGNTVVEATSEDSGGPILSWDGTTNAWYFHQVEGQFWDDVAISGDGNALAVDSSSDSLSFSFPYILDPQINLIAQINFLDLQAVQEGPSLQFDQSGALLYAVVNGVGIDIMDARSGQLRERVRLSEQILSGATAVLQTPSKVMAVTPAGDRVFLLTAAALTVVELDAVPLGIGSVTPNTGSPGTVVTVRGTGFASGTSATANGSSANVSFVDSSILKITIPAALTNGPTQFILMNPDGSKFALDAAFLVQ
jgi:hypothetical protein